jgi:Protein of unknown function (DUF3168)
MSTLIEDLHTLLAPLAAGGAWYAVNTTEPPVYPYIVVQRVASDANASLGGPSNLQNTRLQVDIYALRIADAAAIELLVEAAFGAWATQNVPLLSQDFFEDPTRAFRVSKDYSVWAVN